MGTWAGIHVPSPGELHGDPRGRYIWQCKAKLGIKVDLPTEGQSHVELSLRGLQGKQFRCG